MKLAGIYFLLLACIVFFTYTLKSSARFNIYFLSLIGLKVRFNS